MITLYGFARVHPAVIGETRDLRAEWALIETGLPYRVAGLDHTGGEFDGEAYGRVSCFRQVPVIDDDGFVLSESAAIALYLAEKSGRLVPSDFHGRMRVTQWCFAALATVELPIAEIGMIDLAGPGVVGAKERRETLVQWANRVLTHLARRLDGRTWIACEDFTVADLMLAMVLRELRHTDLVDPFPTVKAYRDRALARPAFERALASYAQRLGVTVDDIR